VILESQYLEALGKEINPLFIGLEGVLPVCDRAYVALELAWLHLVALHINEVAFVLWLSAIDRRRRSENEEPIVFVDGHREQPLDLQVYLSLANVDPLKV